MSILVQKFGGTSVANPERIQKAARRLTESAAAGYRVVAVVSAMGHTTDELLRLAGQLNIEPTARELDQLLSTGEQVTCALMAMAVQRLGSSAVSFTGAQAGIRAESKHGQANIVDIDTTRIHQALEAGQIVVVAGFQGLTDYGDIATLGRGGSDTTAVALAGALGAELCEIYTDVDAVYTTDPRIVPAAQRIDAIPYDEMWELARLGANVLHPRAVDAARQHSVPVRVRSSFHYDDPGTLLCREVKQPPARVVYGLALEDSVLSAVVTDRRNLPKAQEKLFAALTAHGIEVRSCHASETSVSCRVDSERAHEAIRVLHTAYGLDGPGPNIPGNLSV